MLADPITSIPGLLTVADPGTQLEVQADSQGAILTVSAADGRPGLRFEVDLDTAVGYWQPGIRADRALPADWLAPQITSLVRSAPIGVLYDAAGTSLLGWAAGEAVAELSVRAGVSEEGKSFVVEVRSVRPLAGDLVIVLDGTRSTLTTTVERLAQWLSSHCEGDPLVPPPSARVPASGTILPTTINSQYTWDLQVAESVDLSGAARVTTSASYDSQDRPTTVTTTASGMSGSQGVPAVTTSYDNDTGLATGTGSDAGNTATGYDNWGGAVTYSNTVGAILDQSTTTYDADGRVATVVAGPSETAYSYDGVNADGQPERRGLVTRVETRVDGGPWYTSTSAHDASGVLILERLPGQIIRRTSLDIAGNLTDLSINGHVGTAPDQSWVRWTSRSNVQGQVVQEVGSTQTSLGVAVPTTTLDYFYDPASRLVQVNDSRNGHCAVRTYGFDANGNRTRQTSRPLETSCPTTGGTMTTRSYDAADRPLTGANGAGTYTYDLMGRQTNVPGVDAPTPAGGDITIEYDHTDTASSITQGGTTQSFTLDAARRRWGQTTSSASGTDFLQRHYTDSGDSPSWTVDSRNGLDTTTIYGELVSGHLDLAITKTGNASPTAELTIGGLRGDIATTIPVTTGSEAANGTPIQANAVTHWSDYDEFSGSSQSGV